MIIYFAILIPVITSIVLLLWFKHQTLWWEFAIPFFASLLFIFAMKWGTESAQVRCKEYWGSFISRVEYYEDWDEEVPCRHSYDCNCTTTTDANGNEHEECETCYEHSYDVDYHEPYWQLITTTNETIGISEAEYNRLMKFFGNQKFKELNRDYHENDGDEYYSTWMKDSAKAVPVTTIHSYENRVKASDRSVFHFKEVDTSDIKRFRLKEYPPIIGYNQEALIGDYSSDAQIAKKKLNYINGSLGSKKQVRVFVIVFQNQPVEAAMYQEWHWSGANMNELVICIGTDYLRKVKWCYPISWTPAEKLKSDVKQFVISQDTLNLCKLADYMQVQVNKQFVRKDFKEFDYLTVEPSTGAIVATFIFTMIINVLLSGWIISNEFEEGRNNNYRY